MKQITDIQVNVDTGGGVSPARVSNGYCAPDCPEYGGVGYIRYDVPLGHPKFGKVERCQYAQARYCEDTR